MEANSSYLWDAELRPGNAGTWDGSIEVLDTSFANVPPEIRELRVRADAGFGFNPVFVALGARRASGQAGTPCPPDSRARAKRARAALLVVFAAVRARVSPARRRCGACARCRGSESGAGTESTWRAPYPARACESERADEPGRKCGRPRGNWRLRGGPKI
jgi:hypothetical protein